MDEKKLINQEMNYEYLKLLEHYAKQYDYVSDKKSYLRNMIPYEQKLVLLNSKNPYEVLNYLDELDIKATRKILNELTYDEITKVLSLFSSEDKKKFYEYYSDLSLVNQFIKYDKNASEYIEDLNFDRKVDIIDSSNSKTIESTSKVYETMTEEQKDHVSEFITDSSAISALSTVETKSENKSTEEVINDKNNVEQQDDNYFKHQIEKIINSKNEQIKEDQNKESKEEQKQELKKKPEQKEQPEEKKTQPKQEIQESKKTNEFLKSEENKEVESDKNLLDSFEQAKQTSEKKFINKVKNDLIVEEVKLEIIETENQINKTL